MPRSTEYCDYEHAMQILASNDIAAFNELAELLDEFPHGVDGFVGRRWIINAIDSGSLDAVNWMLTHSVDLTFRDEEGYTPLLCAIERNRDDKHEILQSLLSAGAPVNKRGINDFTPAHLAAVRNDVVALRILAKYGADFDARTEIDHYSTPLEEAVRCRCDLAVAFLRCMT